MQRSLREQARSHIGSAANTEFVNAKNQLWERACSRRRFQRRLNGTGRPLAANPPPASPARWR
ncbi:MAG TPA: hypothetical protein DIW52_08695 [Pseudomonas sp.]|nr:hypothetical protein [Pseudomonas sp.]